MHIKTIQGEVMNDWFSNRGIIEKQIVGAIKDAFNTHGSKDDLIPAIAKRVYAKLKVIRRQYYLTKSKTQR